jgi:hypothetical protein
MLGHFFLEREGKFPRSSLRPGVIFEFFDGWHVSPRNQRILFSWLTHSIAIEIFGVAARHFNVTQAKFAASSILPLPL